MKLVDTIKAYNAISEVMDEKMPFRDAHALLMAKKELEPHVRFYTQKERELVEKYAIKDENGNVHFDGAKFQIKADRIKDYAEEHVELDAVEIKTEIKENKLTGIPNVKPAALEGLMLIFEFDELEETK